MSQDWVGSELLEVHHVPYHIIRSDAYGTLEHIGNWMRVTTHREWPETEFTQENICAEWNTIQQWMTHPITPQTHPINTPRTHPITPRTYPSSKAPRRGAPSRPAIRPPHGQPIAIPSISVGAPHTIDPQQVRQNFQEFYAKFGTHPTRHTRGRSQPSRH